MVLKCHTSRISDQNASMLSFQLSKTNANVEKMIDSLINMIIHFLAKQGECKRHSIYGERNAVLAVIQNDTVIPTTTR